MLDISERRQIRNLLKDRFSIEELERLVNATGEDYDSVVRQNANKIDAIMDILDQAERNGWMMDLLRALVEDFEARPQSPDIADAIARVREVEERLRERWGRGTALDDPFQSCFVSGGLPFVNRPQIRDAFSSLNQTAGLRIAVVNGPSGSGKTYSKLLPQFVSEVQDLQKFKVYYKDIAEGDYAITAEKLVQSILFAWSLDIQIPAQMAQSSSYATELSEWLIGKAPPGQTWWIIVDGLAVLKPDPGLLAFLMALAKQIADSPHALRLVLLDLGDQNPLPPSADLKARKVRIGEITPSDLVEYYFKILHRANETLGPFDASLISSKAQAILQQAQQKMETEPHLAKLQEVLMDATREMGLD